MYAFIFSKDSTYYEIISFLSSYNSKLALAINLLSFYFLFKKEKEKEMIDEKCDVCKSDNK